MKHYIVLFSEAEGPVNTWFTKHYIATAEDQKDTPNFVLPYEDPSYQTVKKLLAEDGFEELGKPFFDKLKQLQTIGLTVEELLLNDIHQVTAFFFDRNELLLKMVGFDRTSSGPVHPFKEGYDDEKKS